MTPVIYPPWVALSAQVTIFTAIGFCHGLYCSLPSKLATSITCWTHVRRPLLLFFSSSRNLPLLINQVKSFGVT